MSSSVPPPRTPADPALMDRETLEDEYCLTCERYEELYSAYSQLAVLMDALHRENELLRVNVGDASIATADQTADFSVAAVEAAHTAAAETEQLQSELAALCAENARLRREQEVGTRARVELAGRVEGLKSELVNLRERKEEEVGELWAVMCALEGQVARLQLDLKAGDGMVARLEKAARALRREAEAQGQALQRARGEALGLQQANDELEARLLAAVRPSPPRMLSSPTTAAAAAAAPPAVGVVTPEASTTTKALEAENAALRHKLAAAGQAQAKMWRAGEQLGAELEAAKSQARVWEREALLWRAEAAARAGGESEEDGSGDEKEELARLKFELERVLRGKERLRAAWEEYEREGLAIRRHRCP